MSFTMKDAYSVMLREYPDVMNIEQMSQALGVSTKTGYGLLKSGKVACLKVGRAYRIPAEHHHDSAHGDCVQAERKVRGHRPRYHENEVKPPDAAACSANPEVSA